MATKPTTPDQPDDQADEQPDTVEESVETETVTEFKEQPVQTRERERLHRTEQTGD